MRKYQKSQCLETIKLLNQAHSEIVRYLEKKRTVQALSLLEQCQQGAITIGTMIDATEGEGTETVRCLESYCELLYQIHSSLQQKLSINLWQTQKKLRKSLSKAENSLKYHISTQTEAGTRLYPWAFRQSGTVTATGIPPEPGCGKEE